MIATPRTVTVHPRSPVAGLLFSTFVPGLGSFYASEAKRGASFLVAFTVGANLVLASPTPALLFGTFAVWIAGIVSGFRGVNRWNARHGVTS
ncbi:MAG TPA: hypothetical protein VGR71_16785 [Nitrospira sp.]|nr:hypothetical protein [Nitrospira sp.]